MLTAIRILNIIIWGGLLLYMIPGAFHAVTGKETRRGDPMRLGVAAVAVVMILGNLRWLFAAGNESLLAIIHVLAAAAGAYIIILAKSYGRGPRL